MDYISKRRNPDTLSLTIGDFPVTFYNSEGQTSEFVDVYAVTSSGVAGLLGENIQVMAVSLPPDSLENAASAQANQQGNGLAQIVPTNAIGGTYVLKVKSTDAAKYFAADIGGAVYLALRGTEALNSPVVPVNALMAVCAGSVSPACRER